MQLQHGQTAVVTGAASGIGLALAQRFAAGGLNVVMADVEAAALTAAADRVRAGGVEVHAQRCDVRHADDVAGLAEAAIQRFGAVHVVCNNAGVSGGGDPWFGSITAWDWTIGVNLYGVIHGVRAFLPHVLATGGHIVNTASMAGLYPGLSPVYDATKHAVVALTENLYRQMALVGSPIGVSCLCPGWVRTRIFESERNFPGDLGVLEHSPTMDIVRPHIERVIAEGVTPAAVADLVAQAIDGGRFWVFTDQDWVDLAAARWATVADGINPVIDEQVPGMPSAAEIRALIETALAPPPA